MDWFFILSGDSGTTIKEMVVTLPLTINHFIIFSRVISKIFPLQLLNALAYIFILISKLGSCFYRYRSFSKDSLFSGWFNLRCVNLWQLVELHLPSITFNRRLLYVIYTIVHFSLKPVHIPYGVFYSEPRQHISFKLNYPQIYLIKRRTFPNYLFAHFVSSLKRGSISRLKRMLLICLKKAFLLFLESFFGTIALRRIKKSSISIIELRHSVIYIIEVFLDFIVFDQYPLLICFQQEQLWL